MYGLVCLISVIPTLVLPACECDMIIFSSHLHAGNTNVGITAIIQSRLYIKPPSYQLPYTVITTGFFFSFFTD